MVVHQLHTLQGIGSNPIVTTKSLFRESRKVWQQTVNLCESKLGSIPNHGAKFKVLSYSDYYARLSSGT